jgi:hypothetical protein
MRKISSPRTRLALAALLCAALPSAFAAAGPGSTPNPAPAGQARPTAPRNAAHEALIKRVLKTAGFPEQMQEMQTSMQQGFVASLQRRFGAAATPEARARMDKLGEAIGTAFRAEDFVERAVTALSEDYSEAHLRAALTALDTPLIKRMTEVEKQHTDPAAMLAFAGRLRTEPLPPARVALLARIDEASGASELSARVLNNTARLVIHANPTLAPAQAAAAITELDAHQADLLKRSRAQMAMQFAYTYRDVSDTDLAAYAEVSEADNLHWFNQKLALAMGRQFDTGMANMVNAFRNILRPGGAAAVS